MEELVEGLLPPLAKLTRIMIEHRAGELAASDGIPVAGVTHGPRRCRRNAARRAPRARRSRDRGAADASDVATVARPADGAGGRRCASAAGGNGASEVVGTIGFPDTAETSPAEARIAAVSKRRRRS